MILLWSRMFKRSTEDNHFTKKCTSTITWLIKYCSWSSVRSIKSIKIVQTAPPRIRILKSPHATAFEVFVGGTQVKSSQNVKQLHKSKSLSRCSPSWRRAPFPPWRLLWNLLTVLSGVNGLNMALSSRKTSFCYFICSFIWSFLWNKLW